MQNAAIAEIANEVIEAIIAWLFDSISISFLSYADVYFDDKAEKVMPW